MSQQSIAHVESRTQYTCDICGEVFGYRRSSCRFCGRDLCMKHSISDPRDPGDYPNHFCQSCWSVGEIFREQERLEIERHENTLDAIEKLWKEAAEKALATASESRSQGKT